MNNFDDYTVKFDDKGHQDIYFKGERLTRVTSTKVEQNMKHKVNIDGKRLCTITVSMLALLDPVELNSTTKEDIQGLIVKGQDIYDQLSCYLNHIFDKPKQPKPEKQERK